jgi:hypothetical protein
MPRAQLFDHLLDLADGDRVDAGERLVEQHELRLEDERARHLDAAPLAAREGGTAQMSLACETEFLEQFVQPLAPDRRLVLHGLEDRVEIVRDREAPEDRRFLRQIGDAEPRAAEHRQLGDLALAEEDTSLRGPHFADDQVEGGGLAGAVRTQQPDDLAGLHPQVDTAQHLAFAVALAQPARGEDGARHGFAFPDFPAGAAFAVDADFSSRCDGVTFTVAPPLTFTRFCLMKISISRPRTRSSPCWSSALPTQSRRSSVWK